MAAPGHLRRPKGGDTYFPKYWKINQRGLFLTLEFFFPILYYILMLKRLLLDNDEMLLLESLSERTRMSGPLHTYVRKTSGENAGFYRLS